MSPEEAQKQRELGKLQTDVTTLQKDSDELSCIRAMLLVNFGKDYRGDRYGIKLEDKGTTLNLLIRVLDYLIICPRKEAVHTPIGDLMKGVRDENRTGD